MGIVLNQDNHKFNEFVMVIQNFINQEDFNYPFRFGNIKRLDINGKFIYLWQNARGEVHYSFSILEKEYYTTTLTKLGNILSKHFGSEVEVMNNPKEQLKKIMNVTMDLNKSLSNFDKYNQFCAYDNYENTSSNSSTSYSSAYQLKGLEKSDVTYDLEQNNIDFSNQEYLHQGIIKLATYRLESHLNTLYINVQDLPIIHKESFIPYLKVAFTFGDNSISHKNMFVPTQWMVYSYNGEVSQSFILAFILFMAKNNIHQAFKILSWLTMCFTSLCKQPFPLVLYSSNDIYMKLFYEEIIDPLFNGFQCEQIKTDNINAKLLAKKLDKKVIYNFHNITTPSILNEPSYELTDMLIHKEYCKINEKSVTTLANILITSTTTYIPMLKEGVESSFVEVDSSINDLCLNFNMPKNKNRLANYIQSDFANFVGILKKIDINNLSKTYALIDYQVPENILTGDINATKIFDSIIRNEDLIPFQLQLTTKNQKLIDELERNFEQKRVDKAHLLDYFKILFGTKIYKSNKALISSLRNDYSTTGEPFDNTTTHVRNGRGYYFLNIH